MDPHIRKKIFRAQEVIQQHTGKWLFTEKTALFLFEIGSIAEEEYEQVVAFFAKKIYDGGIK